MAECSESTGMITPPAARAASSNAGPAQTRLSLLASATTAPVRTAASVGGRPAAPMIADITHPAPMPAASMTAPAPAALATPLPARRSRNSPDRPGSAMTASFGRQRRACSARSSTLFPAVRAITSTSAEPCASALAIRSRVEVPTEPVEPRMVMVFFSLNAPTPPDG